MNQLPVSNSAYIYVMFETASNGHDLYWRAYQFKSVDKCADYFIKKEFVLGDNGVDLLDSIDPKSDMIITNNSLYINCGDGYTFIFQTKTLCQNFLSKIKKYIKSRSKFLDDV